MFSDPEKVITQLYVAEGMSVADFGSGIGFYSLLLARKVGQYGHVYSIDVMPDLLKSLKNEANKQGYSNIEVIQGDLEAKNGSGLMPSTVDRIIVANTLFQADHPEHVVREAKRILKHDGKIAVIDWEESYGQIGPHPDHVITKEESRAHFEKAGFVLEAYIDAGSHHYGMLYSLPRHA